MILIIHCEKIFITKIRSFAIISSFFVEIVVGAELLTFLSIDYVYDVGL
jgi:hypothetical protein